MSLHSYKTLSDQNKILISLYNKYSNQIKGGLSHFNHDFGIVLISERYDHDYLHFDVTISVYFNKTINYIKFNKDKTFSDDINAKYYYIQKETEFPPDLLTHLALII